MYLAQCGPVCGIFLESQLDPAPAARRYSISIKLLKLIELWERFATVFSCKFVFELVSDLAVVSNNLLSMLFVEIIEFWNARIKKFHLTVKFCRRYIFSSFLIIHW